MAIAAIPRAVFSGGSFLVEEHNIDAVFTPEDLNWQQSAIVQKIQDFVRDEIVPNLDRIEHKDFSALRELVRKASGCGIASSDIPAEYGGSDLGQIGSALITEYLSLCESANVSLMAHSCFGILPIVYYGTLEQKAAYLPKLSRGEWISAYALSEAPSGSDVMNLRARAVLSADGNEWILNGEKTWVTNGGFADLFVVFAGVEDAQISAFLVTKDAQGLRVGNEISKVGLRGTSTCSLMLSDCRVPAQNLLGQVGKGHKIAFNTLNIGRLRLGAAAIGGARHSLQAALAHTRRHRAFGKSLAEFGLIQHKIAKMAALIFAGESMAYRTLGMIDKAILNMDAQSRKDGTALGESIQDFASECSILKVWGSELLDYATDETLQIAGGIGLIEDSPIERRYRDSRVSRVLGGTCQINRLIITGWLIKRAIERKFALFEVLKRLATEPNSNAGQSDLQGPLAAERELVKDAKRATLILADLASKKYGMEITNQQEIVACLADTVIEIYAMDSSVLRTQKIIEYKGLGCSDLAVAMNQLTLSYALEKAEMAARRIIAAVCEGKALQEQMQNLHRLLTPRNPVNSSVLSRQIANWLIEEKEPTFFLRSMKPR